MKFVEVSGRPQLMKEISWRSNTQTAVNSRNLVALGGPQQKLVTEFAKSFPDHLETRPDASLSATNAPTIKNDDAAQLLCAVYNAMPWLAVKRPALFETDNHAMIFNEHVSAAHVVFVDAIKRAVEAEKDRVPVVYRKSWQLTQWSLSTWWGKSCVQMRLSLRRWRALPRQRLIWLSWPESCNNLLGLRPRHLSSAVTSGFEMECPTSSTWTSSGKTCCSTFATKPETITLARNAERCIGSPGSYAHPISSGAW